MTVVGPTDRADELAALRRRAYGPAADIDTDPAALARLRELEQVVIAPPESAPVPIRTAPALTEVSEAPSIGGPAVPPASTAPAEDRSSSETGTDAESAPVVRSWWRRPAALIAAIAVASVLVGATLVTAGGARPDRTLSVTPAAAEIPFPDNFQWLTSALGISRDSLRSYRGVGELIVWAGTSKDGISCLLVTGADGPFGFGCSREGRDATTDIVLDSHMASIPPTGLAERSTLRFVYRGDRVDVWITEP